MEDREAGGQPEARSCVWHQGLDLTVAKMRWSKFDSKEATESDFKDSSFSFKTTSNVCIVHTLVSGFKTGLRTHHASPL